MTTTIKKVTEEKLLRYLNKIGWDIRGNDINRQIINDADEPTIFFIKGGWSGRNGGNYIELRSYPKQPFGSSFRGSIQLHFDDMWLQYHGGKNIEDAFLSLVYPKGNSTKGSKSFISFYPVRLRDEAAKQRLEGK